MRHPSALAALFLSAFVACAAFAADEAPDALAAAVRDAGQLKVLRLHNVTSPPNLRAFGLTLDGDGVYRAVAPPPNTPPGTPRRTATPSQLAAAMAQWTMSPRAVLPARRAPPPAAERAALERQREVGRQTARRLDAGAAGLATPNSFDARWGAMARPAGNSEPIRRSLLRVGAERLADGVMLPDKNAPPDTAPSAWKGLTRDQIEVRLIALTGDDAGIAARRAELIRLVVSGDSRQRERATELLGRLHDPALLPILLPALRRERDYHSRQVVSDALGAIVSGYKANNAGWSEFLDRAPPILNVMMKVSPDWSMNASMLKGMFMGLDLINLMSPADEKKFLAGFDDPRCLLTMLSMGDTSRIEHDAGVHSDSAALIYARYKELTAAGQPGLGAFLADPAVNSETKSTLLDRLTRYRFIGPELERDEQFRHVLPKVLFAKGSQVRSQTVFSVAVLAAGIPKADFAKNSMDFIRSSSAADARSAVAFFLLHPQMLTAAQRSELETRRDGLDDDLRRSLAAHRARPPVYDTWPKSGLEAALVFTQAGHADNFFRTLTRLGYSRARTRDGNQLFTRGGPGGTIRITATVFPSDEEGWAEDRAAVGKAIVARMSDPKYQVVIYRGHVGDYGAPVRDEQFKSKVFIDLACDSEDTSDRILASCHNCAFFGTNQTAEGAINNQFLPQALSALAARESYAQMSARFEKSMPKLFSRFTGTWSPALLWEAASNRY